jgi:putative ABC transport system permease protein
MFRNYLAAALRNLARNRLYAGITIAGLAIGFAAALLIALFVRDEYSYDKFIPGHERVYRISQTIAVGSGKPIETEFTPMMLSSALKLDFPQIEAVARFGNAGFPPEIRHGNISAPERGVAWVDPDFFRVMPFPVLAGDLSHALDAPDSVVIARSAARKYFGRDTPVGETLLIDKHPMRITAVIEDLPSNTHVSGDIFPSARAPFGVMMDPAFSGPLATLSNRVETYFKLRPGTSIGPVAAQLPALVQRHYNLNLFAQVSADKATVVLRAVPIADIHLQPARSTQFTKASGDPAVVAAIAGVGVLIVLVAAINFVTLMTARAARRAVEVGVRKAAGATRRDLIIQFMGEAFVYVLLAGVVGTALAEMVLPGFNALVQRRISFDYLHDPVLAAGIVGVLVVVALLAGAYPAFVLSGFRPAAVLKGGPVQGSGGNRLRQVLVVVQFSVLIALILVAGTIYRQTVFALNEGMRLDKAQVLLLFAKPCRETLRAEVARLPGVEGAACSSANALALSDSHDTAVIDGRHVNVATNAIDFGFFEVYHIRPSAGRLFDRTRQTDGAAGPDFNPPLVINETAARKMGFASPGAAVGQSLMWHGVVDRSTPQGGGGMPPPARASQIIGVVPDFTFGSVRVPIDSQVYAIASKSPGDFDALALNVRLDPKRKPETLAAIDRIWKRIGDGPLFRYFVDQFTLRLYVDTIVQGAMITASALIALSIACLGLFALSAYTTERRTKEIGIRKAMGASSPDILRLLLWQFTKPVLWANLLALPVAWWLMNEWLKGFAYRVTLAPWTFIVAGLAAVLIAWGTVFVHALRVARARPVGALRYE